MWVDVDLSCLGRTIYARQFFFFFFFFFGGGGEGGCQATDSIPPQVSRKGALRPFILTPSRPVGCIHCIFRYPLNPRGKSQQISFQYPYFPAQHVTFDNNTIARDLMTSFVAGFWLAALRGPIEHRSEPRTNGKMTQEIPDNTTDNAGIHLKIAGKHLEQILFETHRKILWAVVSGLFVYSQRSAPDYNKTRKTAGTAEKPSHQQTTSYDIQINIKRYWQIHIQCTNLLPFKICKALTFQVHSNLMLQFDSPYMISY